MSAPTPRAQPMWRRIAWATVPILLGYLLPEALLTAVHGRDEAFVVVSGWFVEDQGSPGLQFDPVTGYRPADAGGVGPRLGALGSDGTVQTFGHLGYPDVVPSAGARRLLVLGGTTTAGAYLERSWPGGVQARLADSGTPLELVDLSQHGVGLANWWSVITRSEPLQEQVFDGLVLAVASAELSRGFTFAGGPCSPAGERADALCTVEGAASATRFETADEALQHVERIEALQPLPTTELERLLASPSLEEARGPLRPFLASRVLRGLSRSGRGDLRAPCHRDEQVSAPPPCLSSPTHEAMARDLALWVGERRLPVLVVRVPTIDETFFRCDVPPDLRCVADMLGGEVVDGVDAFQSTGRREVRQAFLKGDGRWNQEGADRFAAWMADVLATWPES